MPASQIFQGAAPSGTAPFLGNPNLIGGIVTATGGLRSLQVTANGEIVITTAAGSAIQVEGRGASGAAAVGNPVQTGAVDGSGNTRVFRTDTGGGLSVGKVFVGSDGNSNANLTAMIDSLTGGGNTGPLITAGYVFNGATWDRIRGNAFGGLAVYTVASGGNIADGQAQNTGFGLINSGGSSGQLHVYPWTFNGSTWDKGRGGLAADANAATGLSNNGNMVFNGATWDRMRGNTNGLEIQIRGGSLNLGDTITNALFGQTNFDGNQVDYRTFPMLFNGTTWDRMRGNTTGLFTVEAAPLAANVLDGYQSFTATTGATTLITIPAGRTWKGKIGASATSQTVAATATAGQALAVFSVAGAGVTPAAGNVWGINAANGANSATGTVGSQGANSDNTEITVIAPGGNSVTIQVTTTQSGTASRIDAFAIGALQ